MKENFFGRPRSTLLERLARKEYRRADYADAVEDFRDAVSEAARATAEMRERRRERQS